LTDDYLIPEALAYAPFTKEDLLADLRRRPPETQAALAKLDIILASHNRLMTGPATEKAKYEKAIADLTKGIPVWRPLRVLDASTTENQGPATVYVVQWEHRTSLGNWYPGERANATEETISKEKDWGDQDRQTRLVQEYWARMANTDVGKRQRSPSPASKRLRADALRQRRRGLNPPPLPSAARLSLPRLSTRVQIASQDETPEPNGSGAFHTKEKKGVATVALGKKTQQTILSANAARVKKLMQLYPSPSERWEHWQNEAAGIDQAGMAVSHQLLQQVQQILELNTLVGVHPLQAPASFPNVWWRAATREGWSELTLNKCSVLAVAGPGQGTHWQEKVVDSSIKRRGPVSKVA
jgi:hypothetical protein